MNAKLKKIVRLGTSKTYEGRSYSVYCKIELKQEDKGLCLSITGVAGPLPSGNCLGASGQIVMSRPAIEKPAPGWDQALLKKFWATWDRWHLNDMNAACEHQRKRGETYKSNPKAICKDCGYHIGTAWLFEEIPQDVIDFLKSLPETDQTPAWV